MRAAVEYIQSVQPDGVPCPVAPPTSGASEANLEYTYDAAERLTKIRTWNPATNAFRHGKVFVFGTANEGFGESNRKQGKLVSATRWNYTGGTVAVKESYDYEDAAGRLTKTTTEITQGTTVLKTLERKTDGAGFQPLQNVFGTSATDSAVVTGKTYVYSVRAVSQTGAVSSPLSNADLATTMMFTPLVSAETVVAAAHFQQLLDGVNALRRARGSSLVSWASILPAGVPAPATGVVIQAQHILSLRSAMNAARLDLGFGALTYTDPNPAGLPFKIVYVTEIRGGVR